MTDEQKIELLEALDERQYAYQGDEFEEMKQILISDLIGFSPKLTGLSEKQLVSIERIFEEMWEAKKSEFALVNHSHPYERHIHYGGTNRGIGDY